MRSKLLIALVAALLLTGFSPAAQAAEVGVSGQCYDDDGTGGEDQATVNTDDPTNPTIPTILGTVNALVALFDEPDQVPSGNGCSQYDCGPQPAGDGNNECDEGQEPRKDYLEVHVDASDEAGHSYQFCYDGSAHYPDGPGEDDYECPTSPTGPGSAASPVDVLDSAALLL